MEPLEAVVELYVSKAGFRLNRSPASMHQTFVTGQQFSDHCMELIAVILRNHYHPPISSSIGGVELSERLCHGGSATCPVLMMVYNPDGGLHSKTLRWQVHIIFGLASIFSPVFVDEMFSFGLLSMKRPVFVDETSVFGLTSFPDLG